jgi:Mg2+ and Co2+ transporter CorA
MFMTEAAEASIIVLEAMIAQLSRKVSPSDITLDAARNLEYRKRSFQSTSLRLSTIDKRMTNVIQLSNSQATSAESRAIRADSRIMKFIALLTLIFLPATAVASVLSTPFFNIDWDASGTEERSLQTSNNFWVFWAIVIPLTIVGLLLCALWMALTKGYSILEHFAWKRQRRMTMTRMNSRAFGKSDIESGIVRGIAATSTYQMRSRGRV